MSLRKNDLVAIIGAGPAGLYAAQSLARQGVQVDLFNRDIKPGGLAEYGIYPDKHKIRVGLMASFKRILQMPNIHYRGNILVGQSGDLSFDQLRNAGFSAFMVTTGAQEQTWLGLPGEDLEGVYHANDVVFHYNRLPAYKEKKPKFGKSIAIIGVGNVMLDIVNYLRNHHTRCEVTAFARRGPSALKFDPPSLAAIANCLDLDAIHTAVQGAQGQENNFSLQGFYAMLKNAQEKAEGCDTGLNFTFKFLRSPRRLVGDGNGRLKEIVFEINHLVEQEGQIISLGTGKMETVPVDTVIFSIGSRVDSRLGIPLEDGHYATSPRPRFPIDGISYEVFNPELCTFCEDIFVSGWARIASEGIVGLARKDAERGAKAVLAYLETLPVASQINAGEALVSLPIRGKTIVNSQDLEKLWKIEDQLALEKGVPEFKFDSDEAIFKAIGKA